MVCVTRPDCKNILLFAIVAQPVTTCRGVRSFADMRMRLPVFARCLQPRNARLVAANATSGLSRYWNEELRGMTSSERARQPGDDVLGDPVAEILLRSRLVLWAERRSKAYQEVGELAALSLLHPGALGRPARAMQCFKLLFALSSKAMSSLPRASSWRGWRRKCRPDPQTPSRRPPHSPCRQMSLCR
jgi:hypothetical protein